MQRNRPSRRPASRESAEAIRARETELRAALNEGVEILADLDWDEEDEPVQTPAPTPEPHAETPPPPAPEPRPEPVPEPQQSDLWSRLERIEVEPERFDRNLIITGTRTDPAHAAFDVLRTRTIQALSENDWSRIGITSPTAGCGKSFTSINLAISLSRLSNHRTVLMDMDLRRPGLARYLGLRQAASAGDFLRGELPPEGFLRAFDDNDMRIGEYLAVGVNGRAEHYASELFQLPETAEILAQTQKALAADVMLFDLPPALAQDDVLSFRQHLDCVLVVVGGGQTRPRDMRELQRRLGDDTPILGVVLNKAESDDSPSQSYGYS